MSSGSLDILEKPKNVKMAAMRDALCVRITNLPIPCSCPWPNLSRKPRVSIFSRLGGDSDGKRLNNKKKKKKKKNNTD